jgi:glycosyltransferase involved in cell wall biosynthesis
MQAALAEDVLTAVHPRPRIFGCRTGLDEDRRLSLGRVTPDLESKLLVFVGHGPSGWRGWYKGLDLLFETVALLQSRGAGVRLRIAGSWDPAFIAALIGAARLDPLHVELLGPLENPASAFEGACLYVHLGRGDAWPVSVLEAMSAGLPALVSQWTGSKQAVEQVEGQLVVPLEAQEAAARIEWYLTQPPETRRHLGRRSREVAAGFDMERACAEFARVIHELVP